METRAVIENIVWNYLWGMPLVLILLGTGLYLTIKSGFFQFRFVKAIFRETKNQLFKKSGEKDGDGMISPYQAMSMALGTTIGVGNIGGVATAIAIGGPGAIFWMWMAGIFGMIIKMAEITLAVHYRSNGIGDETFGGPTYYMKKGVGKQKGFNRFFKVLTALFSLGFVIAIFINIQTYTVSEAVANTFNINMMIVGVIYTLILYVMIGGGLKSLGKIASNIVPIMCILYILAGLFIIGKNVAVLPDSIGMIFKSAFTGTAAFGGFAGATFAIAIKTGMSRSVFSNEAGWGSAPMIHASAKVDHPVKQGVLGVCEVFIDTFIVCTITALVIITTGQWSSGLDGATLTLSAFESGVGSFARIVLSLATFLFGITTSSGIYVQIEVVLRYLLGERPLKEKLLKLYKWIYPLPALGFVYMSVYWGYEGSTLWLLSDITTALPIFANIIALFILAPKFIELLNDYKARYLGLGKVNKKFKVFYEDK